MGKEEARGDAERREDMLAAFTDMAQGKFLDKVAHVTSKDIKNLPVDKYVLVDVREDALRKVSHIPGSITQGDFERKTREPLRGKLLSRAALSGICLDSLPQSFQRT